MTDDYGQPRHRFPSGRPITDDGKLIWVPWVIGDKVGHEFWLDDKNLGQISLDEALKFYDESIVEKQK